MVSGRSRGWESMQAEERCLTKRASGIGTGMILLKAKVCMHHSAAMVCSPVQAKLAFPSRRKNRSWERRGEEKKGTEPSASSNPVLHSNRHWAPNLTVKASGNLAPGDQQVPPHLQDTRVHSLHIYPENQAAQAKTGTGQKKMVDLHTSSLVITHPAQPLLLAFS